MSRGVNKVILVGSLENNPEVKNLPNGNTIANISLATSESWKDHNTAKNTEITGQYLTKGLQIYIEGKLQTRKWQDQSGADRYSIEIVLQSYRGQLVMLDSKPESQGTGERATAQSSDPGRQEPLDDLDDSIPF